MQLRANNFLDELVGPLQPETITTVYGPPGSGKSTIGYIYLTEAIKIGKKVIVIDTESRFSIERIKQLRPDIKLENLIVFSPKTFEDQQKTILSLVKTLRTINNVGLVIIDSLAMLYRVRLGDNPKGINKDLSEQLRLLSEVSTIYRVPVLMINQMYYHFTTKEKKIIGGTLIDHWSKVIIEIDYEDDVRTIKLVKHKFRRVPSLGVEFEIVNDGVNQLS